MKKHRVLSMMLYNSAAVKYRNNHQCKHREKHVGYERLGSI